MGYMEEAIKTVENTKFDTKGISGTDLAKTIELANKLKEDKSYNIVPEIPASVFSLINETIGKDTDPEIVADAAKMIVTEIAESSELEVERENLKKELKEIAADAAEDTDEFIANQREVMEKRLKAAAENESDPETKSKLMAISQAFTDAYTLEPLYETIKTKEYKKALHNDKYWKRYCMDFDFAIQQFGSTKLAKITGELEKSTIVSFEDGEVKRICVALAVHAHHCDTKDKAQVWFLYNIAKNLLGLAYTTKVSKDSTEKVEYLNKFFEATKDM